MQGKEGLKPLSVERFAYFGSIFSSLRLISAREYFHGGGMLESVEPLVWAVLTIGFLIAGVLFSCYRFRKTEYNGENIGVSDLLGLSSGQATGVIISAVVIIIFSFVKRYGTDVVSYHMYGWEIFSEMERGCDNEVLFILSEIIIILAYVILAGFYFNVFDNVDKRKGSFSSSTSQEMTDLPLAAKLLQLKSLYDSGILSEEEFENEKKHLLNALSLHVKPSGKYIDKENNLGHERK